MSVENENHQLSPSILEDLKSFRFKKNGKPKIAFSDASYQPTEAKKGDKVVQTMSDDDIQAGGLVYLRRTFPFLERNVLEDALFYTNGNVKAAAENIRIGKFPSQTINKIKNTINNTSKWQDISEKSTSLVKKRKAPEKLDRKKFKRIKGGNDFSDSGEDNDEVPSKKEDRVFNSDEESDAEISNDVTGSQKKVFEFLSDANLSELFCMPGISKKKAENLIALRPFNDWKDLVEKIREDRHLGTEILNAAQDFLHTRKVINDLMEKCIQLSVKLQETKNHLTDHLNEQPSLLSPELKLAPYQMIGVSWLIMLHSQEVNGILADEMGLGKTVQIIAFLAYLKEKGISGLQLITVPASTLDNWDNELARWCPSLNVLVYHGSQEDRRAIRHSILANGLDDYDIFLTTYSMLSSTAPEEKKMFRILKFDYVIFDEAHMLKNMNTIRYKQLSLIPAKRRILLTGTPLQNNLLELMSLLTFVMPEMFASKREYMKCLFGKTSNKDENKTEIKDELKSKFEQEQISNAKRIMKPFVLRRLKKDVLQDLPKKIEQVEECLMCPRQRQIYDEYITDYKQDLREETESGVGMLMKLRRISNHPLLVRDIYNDEILPKIAAVLAKNPNYKENNADYIIEDLSFMSDFDIHEICEQYPKLEEYKLSDDLILESGKFQYLDSYLPKLFLESRKVLIFSQFVIMLNILSRYLNIRAIKHLRLDGNTPVVERQDLIDQFNSTVDIPVFLLSTRAGGLGINLTSANTVILHDLDFNPYNDKQAEDRCHRVGQTKPVTVIRLISKDSVEEDIHQIACNKLNLEQKLSEQDSKIEATDVARVLKKALSHVSPMKNVK